MVTNTATGGPTRRQVRDRQRLAHLAAGAVLLVYVYAAPLMGPGFAAAVRWLVLPALVISGVALWQWHRVRKLLRGTRAKSDA